AELRRLAGDAYVIPHEYQGASLAAFYGGYRHFAPAEERMSQLDLWDDRPGPGQPIVGLGLEIDDPTLKDRYDFSGSRLLGRASGREIRIIEGFRGVHPLPPLK